MGLTALRSDTVGCSRLVDKRFNGLSLHCQRPQQADRKMTTLSS